MSAPRPSEGRIKAAISAAQDKALPIAEIRIEPDGTLRILVIPAPDTVASPGEVNTCDALFKVVSG